MNEVGYVQMQEGQPLRDVQARMAQDLLDKSWAVQFRWLGNTLSPMICPGNVTKWEPVDDPSALEVGDIILATPDGERRPYGYIITKIAEWETSGNIRHVFRSYYYHKYWQLGNLKDGTYGWCYDINIYGRLTEIATGRCAFASPWLMEK